MSRRLQLSISGLVLLALGAYVYYKVRTSPEWQNFDFERFQATVAHLDYRFLVVALVMIYSTYLLRSLRWREFLLPIKAASVWNLLSATVIGFGGLALLGRPGELLRPYLIARKEEMPLTTQMAVWVLERIYDLCMVILLAAAAMYFYSSADASPSGQSRTMTGIRAAGVTIMGMTAAGIVALALFRRYWESWAPKLTAPLPARLQPGIRKVLQDFGQGLESLRSGRAFGMGVLYTVLVWASISVGYFFTLKAFGPPLSEFSFPAAVLVMGFAIGGSMLQVPGIGGGSQVVTIVALTELYGVRLEMATSAAIILWLLTFVAVVPPALLFLFREGLTWRKLRLLAAEE